MRHSISKHIKRISKLLTIILGIIVFSYCGDNIVQSPLPFIDFTFGPVENDTLSTDKISFSWKANQDDVDFSYSLYFWDADKNVTNLIDWSEYEPVNTITLNNMDDGQYLFSVRGRIDEFVSDPLRRNFFIDAIKGPAFVFYPSNSLVKSGASDTVSINADQVNNIKHLEMLFYYDSKVSIDTLTVSDQLFSISGNPLNFTINDTTVVIREDAGNDLKMYPAKYISLENSAPFFGSGNLIDIIFTANEKGLVRLGYLYILATNSSGEIINLNPSKPGFIYIQ
ncbi:MAG: hypothetical protein K9G57_01030 [Ignavibacteriales bacterium]|nr:hypothetical protein [Ignavibacteriales bacterium]